MINPTKHSHPDLTVINATCIILKHLQKKTYETYDFLLEKVKTAIIGGDTLFLPALNFLFLLGLINYHSKRDSIEYVGPK